MSETEGTKDDNRTSSEEGPFDDTLIEEDGLVEDNGEVLDGTEEDRGNSFEQSENESNAGDDDESDSDTSELIRLASAAAIRDAVKMRRSDSDLSESSDELDDEDILDELLEEDGFPSREKEENSTYGAGASHLSVSNAYMEQASYEVSLVEDIDTDGTPSPKRRTELKPSGRLGRMANRRSSSLGIIHVEVDSDEDEHDDDGPETAGNNRLSPNDRIELLRPRSSEFETFHSLKSMSDGLYLSIDEDDNDERRFDSERSRPLSPPAVDDPTSSLELFKVLEKCGMDISKRTMNRDVGEHGVALLHGLFDGFCQPPLRFDSVRQIYQSERRRMQEDINERSHQKSKDEVALPVGIVIQRPSSVLIRLLKGSTSSSFLMQLPVVFVSSLFRILLRLLEGYTDSEYDYCVVLASCPWQHEALFRKNMQADDTMGRIKKTEKENFFVGTTSNAITNSNLMYTIVRLTMEWETPLQSLLSEIRSILIGPEHRQRKYEYLLFPIIRLLGVLGAVGITVKELREIIGFTLDKELSTRTRLLIVRALSVAASVSSSTSSSSSSMLGTSNLSDFFSFVSGPGITRTINLNDQQQATWPFRNDFGAAFHFRVENLSSTTLIRGECILLRSVNENGCGIQISLDPLVSQSYLPSVQPSGLQSTAAVLSITTLEKDKVVSSLKVFNCPLLARVWYHLGIRHTRSRLKGMFSLSSREQLTVILDGKPILNEPMKFPQIHHDHHSKKTISFALGRNFDGQIGSVYIFRENVSDATFKALFEISSREVTMNKTRGQSHDPKTTNASLAVLGTTNIQYDDLEHIAISSSNDEIDNTLAIHDMCSDDEISGVNDPLSRSAFISRLYISWNPRRKENNFVIELHSGAHFVLDHGTVQAVCIDRIQEVLCGIGGVQCLVSIFESILRERNTRAAKSVNENKGLECVVTFSLVPDLLNLIACFTRGHHQNARELLRCGAIDIIENLLLEMKSTAMKHFPHNKSELVRCLFVYPTLSKFLVRALLDLQSSCNLCTPLSTKVFSALLFNVDLWLGSDNEEHFVSLYPVLLPVLSKIVMDNPRKVCNVVRPMTLLSLIQQLVETKSKGDEDENCLIFRRELSQSPHTTRLTSKERVYLTDTYLSWILQVFVEGHTIHDFSAFASLLSKYLEHEWNASANEISEGKAHSDRPKDREELHQFLQKACSVFYYILELAPSRIIEDFASCCGSIDAGIAWILSALVNSYSDSIRAIGIRCVGVYMSATSHGPDLPLSFSNDSRLFAASEQKNAPVHNTLQGSTMSLISNVGHGILHAGERNISATTNPRSKFTPRIIYKLLWHLLKSHRYRIGPFTQSALLSLIFDENRSFITHDSMRKNLLSFDQLSPFASRINTRWMTSTLCESSFDDVERIRDALSINTLLRVLRFLPLPLLNQWLSLLVTLSKTREDSATIIVQSTDWQSCLFQLVSENIEGLATIAKAEKRVTQEGNGFDESMRTSSFNLTLELYSTLLGHVIRNSQQKSIPVLEEVAALQRVYVNGSEVFALILSHLLSNLSRFGVSTETEIEAVDKKVPPFDDTHSTILKRNGMMVTESILSNGTKGMKLSIAMQKWRFLKYLIASATAFTNGLISNPDFYVSSLIHNISDGILGVRLPEGLMKGLSFEMLKKMYTIEGVGTGEITSDSSVPKHVAEILSVHIVSQALSLIDVFIFPDFSSLDIKSAQLHGLALVRGGDSQTGNTQGPFLTSLLQDSLILLCRLEPCSVKMLQCCGRLRCFVHYSLELIRESEAMERYSVAFNQIVLPFDRLLLLSFLRSHFVLRKCDIALKEIESDSMKKDPIFTDKESRKKSYRRIFRVVFELREILMTIHEKRNTVLKDSLTPEALVAFKSCMESKLTRELEKGTNSSSEMETLVRSLLASDWVQNFEMSLVRKEYSVLLANDGALSLLVNEEKFAVALDEDTTLTEKSYQKSLNPSFEQYLEKQRKWAETSAVRDLEFQGDTTLKKLSIKSNGNGKNLSDLNNRSFMAISHWKKIEKQVGAIRETALNWRIPKSTDRNGKRVLLIPNLDFDSHESARYDLAMGQDKERYESEKAERYLKDKVSDLMKRNSEAIASYDEILALDEDQENDQDEANDTNDGSEFSMIKKQANVQRSNDQANESVEIEVSDEASSQELLNDSENEWAKVFLWQDNETTVARFEEVMIVTLRYTFFGNILLTTAGVYFHQTEIGVNVITKGACPWPKRDRRWRLNGLKEVHGRRYLLKAQALELFFADSQEIFLNFTKGQKQRDKFYAKLRNSCHAPLLLSPKSLNPRVVFRKTRLTDMWKKRIISNFDYLMLLNRMAGRTFNDISQYPVFPWILSDYESDKIDLSDSRVYRDLSKPVGALNSDRLAVLIERYKELESFGFPPEEKFLYGSHYSSPGLILHFLIRQEPFTSMAIDLQSGKFDCPDRLFFDIRESWKSCNTSSSDVKELIPEIFTMPEMLQNTNNFSLGKTQKGIIVNDVGLPPWAKGSPHEFVRMNRLALESEYVSSNLHNWIDLIFGYKQRGVEAEKAWNLFHFLSYEGSVDLDKIKDEIDRVATESHIQNFGQTPSQLIVTDPHPSRYGMQLSWRPLINNISTAVKLRCHTPSQQFGGKGARGACAVLHMYVKSDSIVAIYSDLKVGFFWWFPKKLSNRLRPDRLQSLPSRNLSYSRSVMKRGSAVPQTFGEGKSSFGVGNWSFATTIGGYEKEQLRRRNSTVHSRLASAKDALYTEAAPLLVSCGYWDNTVKVHSSDAWKLEASDNGGHRGPIRCLAVGEDGGIMVTGGDDCTCRIWVVDYPEMAAALSNGYTQTALGRHPNENEILSCCRILLGHESAISCVALSTELDVAVSGSIEGIICIHTIRTGEFIRSFAPSTSKSIKRSPQRRQNPIEVRKIVLEQQGRMVIQMGDNQLYTYTINGTCLSTVNAGEPIHDMRITGEIVVTGGENGHVYIRNLATLKILSGMNLSKHGPIRCVTFTPPDVNPIPQFLFIGSDNGMISVVEENS